MMTETVRDWRVDPQRMADLHGYVAADGTGDHPGERDEIGKSEPREAPLAFDVIEFELRHQRKTTPAPRARGRLERASRAARARLAAHRSLVCRRAGMLPAAYAA